MGRREFWESFILGSNRENGQVNSGFNQEFESSSNSKRRNTSGRNSNNQFESSSNLNVPLTSRRNTKTVRGNVGVINTSMCQELANIIGGSVITSTPVCVVQRLRNINATILGRRTRSPLALPFALSFENNQNGKTLNLGETVILQKEINPFLSALRKRGITVTALHNHWLFEEPRLMYMHWESVSDPFTFAMNSIEAAKEAGIF